MDGDRDDSSETASVEALKHSGGHLVRVTGELDLISGPVLRETLIALADGGATDVVVDLTDTTFLDSVGLGILLNGLKRLRLSGGLLRLAGCRPQVQNLLTLTALDRVLPCYPTVEQALADHLLPDSATQEQTVDPTPRREPN